MHSQAKKYLAHPLAHANSPLLSIAKTFLRYTISKIYSTPLNIRNNTIFGYDQTSFKLDMSDFKVNVDFDKLPEYFSHLSAQQKALIIEEGGYLINFESEYYDEVYQELYEGLSEILTRYHLEDHINELYYIVILMDNQCQEIRYHQETAYNDDKTAKEVAQFLLAFKSAKPNQAFQLVAKSMTDTASIKNPVIAKWMSQLILDAIEAKNFPFEVFGESILLHLFGKNPMEEKSISMERLESASTMKIKKPTYSDLLFRFALQIRTYLNEYTDLKTTGTVLLANSHANLFFDIFELFGYFHRNNIESEPKDYIHALFRNQLKLYYSKSGQ
jgi:hypothetical protein